MSENEEGLDKDVANLKFKIISYLLIYRFYLSVTIWYVNTCIPRIRKWRGRNVLKIASSSMFYCRKISSFIFSKLNMIKSWALNSIFSSSRLKPTCVILYLITSSPPLTVQCIGAMFCVHHYVMNRNSVHENIFPH